jgi:hypothetical protein
MSLGCWYYIAGIVSAMSAVLGLAGLTWYAIETWKLRKAAQEQVESAIKPCVLFLENPPAPGEVGGFDSKHLLIKNVGNGPAINVRWKLNNQTKWLESAALETGTARESPLYLKSVINQGKIECMFDSINGITYITETGFSGDESDLDLRHTFRKADMTATT